jgi:hypothetical protein
VGAFVSRYEDWFRPTPDHDAILGFVAEHYPKEAGEVCARIFARHHQAVQFENVEALRSRQDLCLVAEDYWGPQPFWIHSELFGDDPTQLEGFLESCKAEAAAISAEGTQKLQDLPAETLRLALEILYSRDLRLPENPEKLLILLQDADKLSWLLKNSELASKLAWALCERMDHSFFFDHLPGLQAGSPNVQHTWAVYLSYHLDSLARHPRFGEIPETLMAELFAGERLMAPEEANFRTLLHWAEMRTEGTAHSAKDLLLQPLDEQGSNLLSLVRFEQFELERFVRLLKGTELLDPATFQSWVEFLGDVPDSVAPQASEKARGTLRIKRSPDQKTLDLRWHCRIPQHPEEMEEDNSLLSPTFEMGGGYWQLALEPHRLGHRMGIRRHPFFKPINPQAWSVDYHFPNTQERCAGQRRISDSTTKGFWIIDRLGKWEQRWDRKQGYMVVEAKIRILD